MFRRHSYSGFSETISGEGNGTHLFCAIPLVHGDRHLRLSAFHFCRVYPPNTPSSTPMSYNTLVNLYLMLKVNISERDHSKVYPRLIVYDITEQSKGAHPKVRSQCGDS
jgi:hypothetical protein